MELNLEGLKIENVDIAKEIQRSFIDYSVSVIVGRALPDVRDGLKPVHRRILYAMYQAGLTSDKPFKKSATTVGDVLGHFHPHGDQAVYDAMVRMAQAFSMRYPLIDGHGNFGNIDGDGAAAYRYTEARMARLANEMLADIEKEVVDFTPNFDNSRKEPVVLPSRIPNLLVNGSVGIAVGMATNIPPHNLCEVIDAVEYLADHRDCEVRDLMAFIKGPDFPTYGKIYGTNGIEQAYLTGRGKVLMRARTHFEENGKRTSIVVDEIPYQVNKSNLVKGIADLVHEKRVEGISDLRDESCKGKIRIVIDLKLDANPEVILNLLFKNSQLQETFAINMLALVNNEPKTLNLKQMLSYYLDHQEDVLRRKTEYDLAKAKARLHILEGYKIAIDNIDEVVHIIRSNKTVQDAKQALIDAFGLSDAQGQAIVEMPLGRLAGLEIEKILEEMAEKRALIETLEGILADEAKLLAVLKEGLDEMRRRYGDERRTEIEANADDIVLEDLIEKHKCVVTITHAGYIKRQRLDEYEAQNRGGQGNRALTTREEDSVRGVFVSHSHNFVFFFSNRGRLFARKCYMIPESGKNAKGTNLVNILPLEEGEKITAFQSEAKLLTDEYLTFVTKNGVIKRTRLADFASVVSSKGQCRKNGIRAITLDEGDELLFVEKTDGSRDLLVAASNGLAARFAERQIRVMGRTARGVRAIRLTPDAGVCGFVSIEGEGETRNLVTITENGVGKRCSFDEFTVHHRGGKGMKCQTLNEKTGARLVGIAAVAEDDDLLIIVSSGKIIRIRVADISLYSRTAAGVYLVKFSEKDQENDAARVVDFQRVVNDDELEKAAETADESTEVLPETDPDADPVPAEPVEEDEEGEEEKDETEPE